MKSEHLDLPASFVFKGQLPHLLFAILMAQGCSVSRNPA